MLFLVQLCIHYLLKVIKHLYTILRHLITKKSCGILSVTDLLKSYFLKVGFIQYIPRNATRNEQEDKTDEKERE